MSKIISISSQVSKGYVGNSAIEFALQRLGHEVWSIPSVLLSNHPAYEHYGGIRLKASMLRPILEGLDMNDSLEEVDAVITGYLPTEESVNFALEAVNLIKTANPDCIYLCDPVFGDDEKGQNRPKGQLYIEEMAAKTNNYMLLPMADIITPNRFELSWLTDMPVENIDQAIEAMVMLSSTQVLATSIPDSNPENNQALLANVLQTKEGYYQISSPKQDKIPHGTGDLMAAFYLAEYCQSKDPLKAFGKSIGYIKSLVDQSQNMTELDLIGAQNIWTAANSEKVIQLKQKTRL